ncbi:putative metal-dependent hydrolase [Streptomyces sp. V1I6]|nr:putative metal-dependent hydrolase [Streptomyces sp. V1I6]
MPIHLVDYVVAHELAHVRVSGHGSDYWQLLSSRRLWMGDLMEEAG